MASCNEGYETGKNTLFALKCVECTGFQDGATWDSDNPTTVPPLATINADGDYTSESSSELTQTSITAGNTHYRESQPVMGAHQFIAGKSAVSFQLDQEKFDVMDLNSSVIPRQFFKGSDTLTGSLELNKRVGESIWLGAVMGSWDSVNRRYEQGDTYRKYELWCLVGPDELSLSATSARTLVKLVGVSFDNASNPFENPIKHSIPFSFSRLEVYPNWEDDTGVDGKGIDVDTAVGSTGWNGNNGQSALAAAKFGGSGVGGLETNDSFSVNFTDGTDVANSSQVHTRLLMKLHVEFDSTDNVSATVTVTGTDPYKGSISEQFYVADLDAALDGSDNMTFLTSSYYDGGFEVRIDVEGLAGTTPFFSSSADTYLAVYDVDWKLQSGVPVIES